MKYRKLPVEVEAIQWDGQVQTLKEILALAGERRVVMSTDHFSVRIETPEGNMQANKGDYIIKGIAGEIYPCREDIFISTYEAV